MDRDEIIHALSQPPNILGLVAKVWFVLYIITAQAIVGQLILLVVWSWRHPGTSAAPALVAVVLFLIHLLARARLMTACNMLGGILEPDLPEPTCRFQ